MSSNFSNQDVITAILLTQLGTKDDIEFVKKSSIPTQLMDYRYLMHPVRLSIMKLLSEEGNLTSVEVKHSLEISWGEYYSHINSLKKKEYIRVQDEFVNNTKRQVLYIEPIGLKRYGELKDLLEQFLKNSSSENIHDIYDPELYPGA